MAPARLLVAPGVFLVWGLAGLAAKPAAGGVLAAVWLAGALLGAVPGMLRAPVGAMAVDRQRKRIYVPGGWATLIIGIGEFVIRYVLAVAAAMNPDWREPVALCESVLSGLAAGFFLGWLGRVVAAYGRLPDADLAAGA